MPRMSTYIGTSMQDIFIKKGGLRSKPLGVYFWQKYLLKHLSKSLFSFNISRFLSINKGIYAQIPNTMAHHVPHSGSFMAHCVLICGQMAQHST